MKTQKITKLTILIDVLKSNYGDYYEEYIGQDFLYSVHEDNTSDTIAYLMEHIRKLKKKDKEYPSYLKCCYAIFLELQNLVRKELEEADKQYINLIRQHLTTKSSDRLLLLEIAVHDEDKMKQFCKEVIKDKKEFFSDLILAVVKDYDCFQDDKARKIDNLNHYIKDFSKRFEAL